MIVAERVKARARRGDMSIVPSLARERGRETIAGAIQKWKCPLLTYAYSPCTKIMERYSSSSNATSAFPMLTSSSTFMATRQISDAVERVWRGENTERPRTWDDGVREGTKKSLKITYLSYSFHRAITRGIILSRTLFNYRVAWHLRRVLSQAGIRTTLCPDKKTWRCKCDMIKCHFSKLNPNRWLYRYEISWQNVVITLCNIED